MATLEFLGAAGTVTGSKHLVEAAGQRILVEGVDYREPRALAPGIAVTFRRAGHILGSATVTLDLDGTGRRRRVVFSGDPGLAQALATRIEKELGLAVDVPAYRDRVAIE